MSHAAYHPVNTRVQRGELAVPETNPEMFDKATASDADFVFLEWSCYRPYIAPQNKYA